MRRDVRSYWGGYEQGEETLRSSEKGPESLLKNLRKSQYNFIHSHPKREPPKILEIGARGRSPRPNFVHHAKAKCQ
jgi:hypothetical protein